MNVPLPNNKRSWQVLLIGGASGTGKTSISYPLARQFGVGITEVDDFQVVLKRMTTPEQQPLLHYWDTHPDAVHLPAETIVENGIAIGKLMMPALEAVIANHLEAQIPIILEGDFILPELAAQRAFDELSNDGSVKAVFLIESDEMQLRRNFSQREPMSGEQTRRARVSWLYNQWLRREAEKVGVPTIAARPWDDVIERVLFAIQ